MPTEDQARRYTKLMGIMYMIIVGMEYKQLITYAELERIMTEQRHCSPVELMNVCKELHRFNALVENAEEFGREGK